MPTEGTQSPPFDEQAALEELERLRAAIEESRRLRSQRSDEFEAFVRSFRAPAPAPSAPAIHTIEQQQGRDWRPASVAIEPRAPVDQRAAFDQREASAEPKPIEQAAPTVAAPSAPAQKRRAGALVTRALGGAAILVASVVLLVRPWKAVRSETSSTSSGAAPTAASAPVTTTPAPTPGPAAEASAPAVRTHALEAELNIQRRVWLRVIVDGQRTIERELPAGTRIPLQADRAIVIRAGDAGALRVTINGVDRGPLGKDTEIVTRTFTVNSNQ